MTNEEYMKIAFKGIDISKPFCTLSVLMIAIAECMLFGDYENDVKGWAL